MQGRLAMRWFRGDKEGGPGVGHARGRPWPERTLGHAVVAHASVLDTRRSPPGALAGSVLLASALTGPALTPPSPASAQEPQPRWERRLEASEPRLTIFQAPVAIHLPTAETLGKGEWQFEIGHRFRPPVSDGPGAFWGLDGPVNMRIGLGYALTDRVMLTLARSNVRDNLDLQFKVRALEVRMGPVPVMAGILGGAAWSTEVAGRDASDPGNVQYYGQLILNARATDRWALGVVSSYLHNVLLEPDDPEGDLFLGLNTRISITPILSLEGEWNLSGAREDAEHRIGAFGVELDTAGHFFKVFLTNSVLLNPSHYLLGSPFRFEASEWRLGFTITRLFRF
jgi:hypothetical protein